MCSADVGAHGSRKKGGGTTQSLLTVPEPIDVCSADVGAHGSRKKSGGTAQLRTTVPEPIEVHSDAGSIRSEMSSDLTEIKSGSCEDIPAVCSDADVEVSQSFHTYSAASISRNVQFSASFHSTAAALKPKEKEAQ